MHEYLKEILITEEDIKSKVELLGSKISDEYKDKDLLLVGILKGAAIFLADLSRSISMPIKFDFMSVQSYGNNSISTGEVKIVKDLDYSVKDKHILIVEDIIDSGKTLSYLKRNLIDRGAKSVKIATLLDKPSRREVDIKPDFVGFEVPNEFIVGYGLDYAEFGRNFPFVASLKKEVYKK